MADDLVGTLLILLFTFMAGALTGTIGALFWQTCLGTLKKEKVGEDVQRQRQPHALERLVPAPPPPVPERDVRNQAYPRRRMKSTAPPAVINVGLTPHCERYHDPDCSRCDVVDKLRKEGKEVRKYTPCKVCFKGSLGNSPR